MHAEMAGGYEDNEAVVLQFAKPARNLVGLRINLLRRDALRQIDFAVVLNLRIMPTPQRDVERPRAVRHYPPRRRIEDLEAQHHEWVR
jgi:hypothetical protein